MQDVVRTGSGECVDESRTLPITAIVVTYNEDRRLNECLGGLSFCDQLIVTDLGSEDRSVDIAREHGAEIIHHERLPVVEQVRARVIDRAEYEWVLFIDPDEVFHQALIERVTHLLYDENDVGRVFFPWLFYFRGRPLYGTHWGGCKHKGVLIHRERCRLSEEVYRGIEVDEGYRTVHLDWTNREHHIRHYWMDSVLQLVEKHRRYSQQDAKSRFKRGKRFPGWLRWGRKMLGAFKSSYVDNNGWREGARGLFLSVFWALYQGVSLLALRRYQKNHAGEDSDGDE
jgi:glycosyltransferase involved in cell wall biosynthesis